MALAPPARAGAADQKLTGAPLADVGSRHAPLLVSPAATARHPAAITLVAEALVRTRPDRADARSVLNRRVGLRREIRRARGVMLVAGRGLCRRPQYGGRERDPKKNTRHG